MGKSEDTYLAERRRKTEEEKRKTLDEWAEAEREARRATAREYYQRNKEEILKRQKERLAKMTPEERRAHNQRRYECRKKRFEVNPELKERALERMRKYYREHTEEIRERSQEWWVEHRDEIAKHRREVYYADLDQTHEKQRYYTHKRRSRLTEVDREKSRTYNQAYYERHREELCARRRELRRLKKKQSTT